MVEWNIIPGGVCAPKGFAAGGAMAAIKYQGRKDMAAIFSQEPCEVAGTFTTNVVKAAPVLWDQSVVRSGKKVHLVLVNSGIANACTGEEGMKICRETAAVGGDIFQIPQEGVLVASTGVIGMQIPMDRLKAGIPLLKEHCMMTGDGAHEAALAIMTTDTKPKEIAVEFQVGGKKARLGGMCKGSGMIHPNMCTMLGFLTTDVSISKELLQEALGETVKDTYNMISVDGDTSTNDTVLLLANGLAGNETITKKNEDYECFLSALRMVNTEIAKMIAGDGEGATALMEVQVFGAPDNATARILAKSVVTSNLTKAALFGHDANWGRILCALGYAGVSFDPYKTDISIESEGETLELVKNGVGTGYSEETATKILSRDAVRIIARLSEGTGTAVAWGCDLTYDYVKINGDYRS